MTSLDGFKKGVINMKTKLALLALVAIAAFAQTAPVTFPTIVVPGGVAAVASYNQLGSPRWNLSLDAIYPIVGQAGVYGTTVADILPKKAIDPATKRSFYALSVGVRQGFHKSIISTGRFTFLLGGDVGPSFAQSQPSGIDVSFSTSFVATSVVQLSPIFSFMVPIRMLYVSGIGWNPIAEAGFVVNLSKLPKANP